MELEQNMLLPARQLPQLMLLYYVNKSEASSFHSQKEGLIPTTREHQRDLKVCLISFSFYFSRDPHSNS